MNLMQGLGKTIRGKILLPGDDRYDVARRSWHHVPPATVPGAASPAGES
jgi:hypothetical protein